MEEVQAVDLKSNTHNVCLKYFIFALLRKYTFRYKPSVANCHFLSLRKNHRRYFQYYKLLSIIYSLCVCTTDLKSPEERCRNQLQRSTTEDALSISQRGGKYDFCWGNMCFDQAKNDTHRTTAGVIFFSSCIYFSCCFLTSLILYW